MKNKAMFFIKRLREKGWSDEKIKSFCHITDTRFKWLCMPGCIPKNIEVKRIQAMMRMTPPELEQSVKDVWKSAWSTAPAPKRPEGIDDLSERQRGVLKLLSTASSQGHKASVLARRDAVSAASLRKRGMVSASSLTVGDRVVKQWSRTNSGMEVAGHLGLLPHAAVASDGPHPASCRKKKATE